MSDVYYTTKWRMSDTQIIKLLMTNQSSINYLTGLSKTRYIDRCYALYELLRQVVYGENIADQIDKIVSLAAKIMESKYFCVIEGVSDYKWVMSNYETRSHAMCDITHSNLLYLMLPSKETFMLYPKIMIAEEVALLLHSEELKKLASNTTLELVTLDVEINSYVLDVYWMERIKKDIHTLIFIPIWFYKDTIVDYAICTNVESLRYIPLRYLDKKLRTLINTNCILDISYEEAISHVIKLDNVHYADLYELDDTYVKEYYEQMESVLASNVSIASKYATPELVAHAIHLNPRFVTQIRSEYLSKSLLLDIQTMFDNNYEKDNHLLTSIHSGINWQSIYDDWLINRNT